MQNFDMWAAVAAEFYHCLSFQYSHTHTHTTRAIYTLSKNFDDAIKKTVFLYVIFIIGTHRCTCMSCSHHTTATNYDDDDDDLKVVEINVHLIENAVDFLHLVVIVENKETQTLVKCMAAAATTAVAKARELC